jgi:glycine/D-amino acid oxidase-like deaminating enzyme
VWTRSRRPPRSSAGRLADVAPPRRETIQDPLRGQSPEPSEDPREARVAEHDVVVIGAGHGGIASALALKDRGVAALVVDEADQVASRWQARYDRLRLNTSRPTSHLPGRPYPKATPMFPTRDQVVEHIQGHARDAGLELLLGTRVQRLSRGNGSWTVATGRGEIDARQVVLATSCASHGFSPSGASSATGWRAAPSPPGQAPIPPAWPCFATACAAGPSTATPATGRAIPSSRRPAPTAAVRPPCQPTPGSPSTRAVPSARCGAPSSAPRAPCWHRPVRGRSAGPPGPPRHRAARGERTLLPELRPAGSPRPRALACGSATWSAWRR